MNEIVGTEIVHIKNSTTLEVKAYEVESHKTLVLNLLFQFFTNFRQQAYLIANRYAYEERVDDLVKKYKNEHNSDFLFDSHDVRIHHELRKIFPNFLI